MQPDYSDGRRTLVAALGAAALGATLPADTADATAAVTGNEPVSTAPDKGAVDPVPPLAVRALHRLGFGPARRRRAATRPPLPGSMFSSDFESLGKLGEDDIGYFKSLGGNDDERLEAYVSEQLQPSTIPDPDLTARMDRFPGSFAVMRQSLGTTFSRRACRSFDEYVRPFREVEKATITRAVYSRRQLFEFTVDFWHNHFNIYAPLSSHTYASWHSWDRDIIRKYAFGNFYQFLHASAKHVAMLRYLDNYRSSVRFNENYAREVIELHTLGAEHYFGLTPPSSPSVPVLAENPYAGLGDEELDNPNLCGGVAMSAATRTIAAMYVDDDVYEAARALTGWRYDRRESETSCGTAAFFTEELNHVVGTKSILGKGFATISSDLDAETDGRLALKILAYHPATARHIARKLCQRLICDDPPESVIAAAEAAFFANRLSNQQIARTIRTIVLSPEFKDPALWAQKIKRPFEMAVSAMRAAGCDHTFREDDPTNTSSDFINTYSAAGQRLFHWRPPDGYPDNREHWQGSNTMVQVWRSVDWLIDRDATNDELRVMRIIDITLANLAGNPTARHIVEFWCDWIMGFSPDGGWTGPAGTLVGNAPTALGREALKFFTQIGYAASDRSSHPADEVTIPRDDLRGNRQPYDWNWRLRGLVALILWSPNFSQR